MKTALKQDIAVRPRTISPLRQGHLDGLCGLYSIINAIRWASVGQLRMTHQDCKKLLAKMLDHLERQGVLNLTITEGMTTGQLRRMLKVADRWLVKKKQWRLEYERPWQRAPSRPPLDQALAIIKGHIAQPNCSAIIGIAGGYNHWSVFAEVASAKIKLFDSSRRWSPDLISTDILPVSKSNKKYQLVPGDVFLLTIRQMDVALKVGKCQKV